MYTVPPPQPLQWYPPPPPTRAETVPIAVTPPTTQAKAQDDINVEQTRGQLSNRLYCIHYNAEHHSRIITCTDCMAFTSSCDSHVTVM